MTRDEIIGLAVKAEMGFDVSMPCFINELERFAALVSEAERDGCALLCLETEPFYGVMFAEAIRGRGLK